VIRFFKITRYALGQTSGEVSRAVAFIRVGGCPPVNSTLARFERGQDSGSGSPPGQHDDLGISCALLAWAARHSTISCANS